MRLPNPPLPSPILLGFSGGLDSSVLLQLLATDPGIRSRGLRALHVHHGLHADADAWAAHCRRVCAALDVPLEVVRVQVNLSAGLGVEGAARAARHAAFAAALGDGEILALAHHRDDQAETFLLRALRGAGADGLAAMRPWRRHARGWLWRPLLELPRAALQDHAASQHLQWIDDPANMNADFDRNFLRNAVLPLLRQRWPDAPGSFARSAALCAQAVDLLETEDAAALAAARGDPQTLEIRMLQAMPEARRARVLRRWIADLQLPPLPGNGIARIEHELLASRRDASPQFDWQGARVWRSRGLLHADVQRASLPTDWAQAWDGRAALLMPAGERLQLVGAPGFDAPLRVHARQGGERIVLPGRRHSHALKHVLQHAGMPPWQRARLPLLSAADGSLLAAGDKILSAPMAAWLSAHGAHLSLSRPVPERAEGDSGGTAALA
jgi:tRNA(Ile)-lysidine synthase